MRKNTLSNHLKRGYILAIATNTSLQVLSDNQAQLQRQKFGKLFIFISLLDTSIKLYQVMSSTGR